MSRLGKKFVLGIGTIILIVTGACVLLNHLLVEKYYLKIKSVALQHHTQQLVERDGLTYQEERELEKEKGIVIARVKLQDSLEKMNEECITQFQEKGLKIHKFWLWEEEYQKLLAEGQTRQIYNQKGLQYSILVQFVIEDDTLLAVAKTIPHLTEAIHIINTWTTGVLVIGGMGMLLLIMLLVNRMITPLGKLNQFAKDIGKLQFSQITIKTGDEIEDLAEQINDMSQKLKEAHQGLQTKNQQMKNLISNMAHELKTPIALVKAYGEGMKDGIDDGTFLETILFQSEEMGRKVEALLQLSRSGEEPILLERVNVSRQLSILIDYYELPLKEAGIRLDLEIQPSSYGYCNKEAMETVFGNLLTNAIKYTSEPLITIKLVQQTDRLYFTICNATTQQIEVSRLWEPFYVGESSRNTTLSGTGLGLSIVKNLLEKQEMAYQCKIDKGLFIMIIQIGT